MASKSQSTKGGDRAVSLLTVAIAALDLGKEISSITPAKAVFGSVSFLLGMIKVRFPPSTQKRLRFTHT
jgi:hypothetical protein